FARCACCETTGVGLAYEACEGSVRSEAGATATCAGCFELRIDGIAVTAQPEPVASTPRPRSLAATMRLFRRMHSLWLTGARRACARPYRLREVPVPEIWATRLTLGLVKSKLDEHGLLRSVELREAVPEDGSVEIGPFRVEFVRMAHSIPDNVAVLLECAAGRVLFTSDYKIDHTPVDGLKTDVGRLAEIGNRGVDLLLGDSTNAERPGVTG